MRRDPLHGSTFNMKPLVKRPAVTFSAGNGLLRNDHFQVAYATNDIERACAIFRDRFGIKDYRRLEGPMAEGGKIRVELAWAGGTMYELVCAEGPGSECFTSVLPPVGFSIRPHHLGHFVHSQAEWVAIEQEIERGGWTVARKTDVPGFLKAYIIGAPELGHYLEYIYPEAGGIAFFEGVPSS
jgi:hypothetical protein